MKLRLAVLSVLLLSVFTYGQGVSLLESYKIPTISFFRMEIYGQDFLNFRTTNFPEQGGKDESFSARFGLSEQSLNQSPMSTRKTNASLNYNYDKVSYVSDYSNRSNETSTGQISIKIKNDWYLNNERGFSIFAEPGLMYAYNFSEKVNQNLIEATFGGGYGRIIQVQNVVQAYLISDELGYQFSDDKLLQLAEIIEKNNKGYYYSKFKDNSEIEFFKDIAAITGKPENEAKLRQIMFSTLYKTSTRSIGWHYKLGINYLHRNITHTNYGYYFSYPEGENADTDLFTSFTYALPLDLNKQLTMSVDYSKNLDDEAGRMPKLGLSALFSIDHSYTWSSSINAYYKLATPKEGDNLVNLGVILKTDLVLLNKFSVYSTFSYTKLQYGEYTNFNWSGFVNVTSMREFIEFNLGFKYNIF
jgi:hypothetical protein